MPTLRSALGLGSSFQRRELTALGLLAAQIFFLAASDAAVYVVGYALFLDRFGAVEVPYLYIILGIVAAIFFFGLALLQRRVAIGPLSLGIYGTITLFLLVNWAAFRADVLVDVAIYALAAFFPMFLTLLLVATGGQAGFIFNVRQMKRVFPLIITVAIVGFVLGSLGSPYLIPYLDDLSTLLLIGAGAALLGLLFGIVTLRRFPAELTVLPRESAAARATSVRSVLASRFTTSLFAYQLLSAVGTQLIIYVFMTQAELQFTTPEQMADFFGAFAGWRNVASLVFMLFLAGSLLSRFGLRLGLTLNPLVVVVLGGSMLLFLQLSPGATALFFWLSVLAYVLDNLLSDGMTSTSIKTAYQVLPDVHRTTIETVVEGIGKPLAFVLTGLTLILFNTLPALTLTHVLLLTMGVSIAWTGAALMANQGYSDALLSRLRRQLLDEAALSLDDASTVAVVMGMLDEGNPRLVRLALDLLATHAHPALDDRLVALLHRPEEEVQIEALTRIGRHAPSGAVPAVAALLQSAASAPVAAAALRALARLDPAGAADRAAPYLDHDQGELQQAALITALDGAGDADDAARRRLQSLAQAPDVPDRVRAAGIAAEVACGDALLPALLDDPEPDVRRAALRAAARRREPAHWPQVLRLFEARETQSEALDALLAGGEAALPAIADALDAPDRDAGSRARLLRVAGQIGGEPAIALLLRHLDDPYPIVRHQLLASLAAAGYRIDGVELAERLTERLERGYTLLRAQQAMGDDPACAPIRLALRTEAGQERRALFLLLSLHYDRRAMKRAGEHVAEGDSRRRGLALETLDVYLPRRQRDQLLPFVDPTLSLDERLQSLGGFFKSVDQTREAWLEQMILDEEAWPETWTRACALYSAARLALPALDGWLDRLPSGGPAIVTEVAAWARRGGATGIHGASNHQAGEEMLTIEKVAILQNVDIFADVVPDSLLAAVARIIETVHLPPDQTFITEGEIEDCMYVVLDGEVRVHSQGRTIITLGEGKSVGELAVLDPEPRSASVTTVGECRLFRIDRTSFDEVMADRPGIARGVIRALCDRVRAQGRLMAAGS